MKRPRYAASWLTILFLVGATPPFPARADDAVLVELFTSQGCSSCPPADRLLSALGREGDGVEIIPLAFHVDYWNYIGWKDVFSSPRWSARQRSYTAALPAKRTYTPQLVVQGQYDCVGSSQACIQSAVRQASAHGTVASVEVTQAREVGGSIYVEARAEVKRGQPGVVAYVAVYENGLSTEVRRGENRGRALRNDFVVRKLEEAAKIPPGDTSTRRVSTRIPIRDEWKLPNLGVVVFLQDPSTRKVLGTARAPLGAHRTALEH